MIKLLVYIKHNLKCVWKIVELCNGFIFSLMYRKHVEEVVANRVALLSSEKYQWRFLTSSDLRRLEQFFENQPQEQFTYFKPHGFSLRDLEEVHRNASFLMLGVFDGEQLVGYFFLRCFCNKKCFTGRIVSADRQGEGLSKIMGRSLIDSAWDAGFRVFGTASRTNFKSLGSYRAITKMNVIRELDDGYILFEYVKGE